ncbi:hypothetical protein ACD661_04570 [Legionella lytica]|uniref:Uncharacterized protein n=1 Tax=Legionella lytica TaxID=96232 RepID=A0ABW8D8K8_9GAMM
MKPKKETSLNNLKVIAIDINHKHPAFIHYKTGKNAREKMRLLMDKIISAYEQARALTPDAEILVTWREYGITDAKSAKLITNTDKNVFLAEIKKLVNERPMLSILVGPTLIQKKRDQESIPSLIKYYQDLSWVSALEGNNERGIFGQPLINKHLEANFDEVKQIKKGPFYTVKNSAYWVSKSEGAVKIQPIAKKSPFNEINKHTIMDYSSSSGGALLPKETNTVFQPAKGLGKNSFFKLPNNQRAVLQICREHGLGIVVPMRNKETVDVHFVLSASIHPHLDKIYGKHAIFVDNDYFPLHLVKDQESTLDKSVELSVICLFDNSNTLIPVKPFCPLQLFVKPLLEKLSKDTSNQDWINELKKYVKSILLLEQKEYMELINLIDKELIKKNSPEKNMALYEIGMKLIEETQIRYGDETMKNKLKTKLFPQCRKDFLEAFIVNTYLADGIDEMTDLILLFKKLNVRREELNEIDWDCYRELSQKVEGLLLEEPDENAIMSPSFP